MPCGLRIPPCDVFARALSCFLLLALGAALLSCGGSKAAGTSSASVTSPNGVTLSLTLVRTSDAGPTSTVSNSAPGTLIATLSNKEGARMEGVLVAFDTDFAVLNPSSGTALSDQNGAARIQLLAGAVAGAGEVGAEAKVGSETIGVKLSFAVVDSSALGSSLSVTLQDGGGTATTLVRADAPGTLTATLTNSNGAALGGVIVTFETTLATMDPEKGTAITNSSGKAAVQLLYKDKAGADTVKVSATLGSEALSTSVNYQIGPPGIQLGNGSGSGFTKGALAIGASPLAAGGTTSLSVSIVDANNAAFTPLIDVSFTSSCVQAGKSSLDATATTVNGQAVATYQAKGCVGTDTITATANFGGSSFTASGTVTVSSDSVGSLAFVSATPTLIALKGTGGASLGETSTVTFRVKGTQGLVVPNQLISFTPNTTVGGLSLSPATAYTNADGEASTVVRSGTVATSVRVTATVTLAANNTISAQSDQLTVSTGIPDQDSTSIAVSTKNPEAWDYDGVQVDVTAHLADHFNNPVPDGTAVYFTTEGGSIESQCITAQGTCKVKWTSQNPRPVDHRVTILMTAVGNESFREADGDGNYSDADGEPFGDVNDNGILDEPFADANSSAIFDEPFIDANGNGSYTFGEAFVDYNINGRYDGAGNNPAGETVFTDRNGNGVYDGSGISAAGESYTDANGNGAFGAPGFPDLAEAFLDENEDRVRGVGEAYWDFNGNGQYDLRDAKYSGVLCTHTMLCATLNTLHVRNTAVLVMSSSAAYIVARDAATPSIVYGSNSPAVAATTGLNVSGSSASLNITLTDSAGQTLPAGTQVSISADVGLLTGEGKLTISDTTAAGITTSVTISDDDAATAASGFLTIQVQTPKGITTTITIALVV